MSYLTMTILYRKNAVLNKYVVFVRLLKVRESACCVRLNLVQKLQSLYTISITIITYFKTTIQNYLIIYNHGLLAKGCHNCSIQFLVDFLDFRGLKLLKRLPISILFGL